jgi:hypothetical protein
VSANSAVVWTIEPHRPQPQTHKEKKMPETSTLIAHEGKITREQLATVPTPAPTETHRPVPHHEIADALAETLGFRQIAVNGRLAKRNHAARAWNGHA